MTVSTGDLARRLDVDPRLLERFQKEHPNLTVGILRKWADANPDHREAVAEWLEGQETEIPSPVRYVGSDE